jgi:serine/threonine protein kinase
MAAFAFEGFELLEAVGRGGMGVVFKARDKRLKRVVALKTILAGGFASASEVQRFRAEAQAAAHLQHPNIVTIFEVGEADGLPFFSMEYIKGETLAQIVSKEPMAPKRAAGYVKAMAEAIQYAHDAGVLHRDLKPSNVLIDGQDRPRIADFGLAKRLATTTDFASGATLTITGQVLGTPDFMPPEQAAPESGGIGPAGDIYSLGAILYFLLTARPPFTGETLREILSKVLNSPPVPPRRLNRAVPRDLETVCLKCLEKKPRQRYASAAELAADLGRFLNDEPIQARPVGPLGRAARWCRRYPATASLAGSLLITLAALLAFVAASSSGPKHRFHGPPSYILAIDGTTFDKKEVGLGFGVAVDTNGDYWAPTLYDPGLIIRSGKTDKRLSRIALDYCPGGVSLDISNRLAWITAQCGETGNTNIPSNDRLWVFNADTHAPVIEAAPCGGINGTPEVVNPLTGRFYHNCDPTRRNIATCQRVDFNTFLPSTASFGPVFAVHPTANLLYAAGPSNSLQILDGGPDPEKLLTNVSLPSTLSCVAVNPKLDRIYIGFGSTNLILVLDARTGSALDPVALNGEVQGLAVDTERNRLFAVAGHDERKYLFVIDGASQRVIELPVAAGGPVFNPMYNKIYVWGNYQKK